MSEFGVIDQSMQAAFEEPEVKIEDTPFEKEIVNLRNSRSTPS